MYPNPIVLQPAPDGRGPVLLRWPTHEDLTGFLVYRSPRAIAPEETEGFYSRTLDITVRCAALPADRTAAIDPDSRSAHYCVLGRRRDGLVAVPLRLERLSGPGPLPEGVAVLKSHDHTTPRLTDGLPELVYAASDRQAEAATARLASGLLAQYGRDDGEEASE